VLSACLAEVGDREGARQQLATAVGIFTTLGAEEQRLEAEEWAKRRLWAEG